MCWLCAAERFMEAAYYKPQFIIVVIFRKLEFVIKGHIAHSNNVEFVWKSLVQAHTTLSTKTNQIILQWHVTLPTNIPYLHQVTPHSEYCRSAGVFLSSTLVGKARDHTRR